jgi:P-type Cu+ transporter
MHCASCAARVEKALTKMDGVVRADVDYASGRVLVSYDPDVTGPTTFASTIDALGYRCLGVAKADSRADEDSARHKALAADKRRAVAGIGVGLLLMALMYVPVPATRHLLPYLLLVISFPAFVYTSLPIFAAAMRALRTADLTMDVMYAMGIGVAYVSSVLATCGLFLSGDFMFYDTAVMLAGFLMLGRFLEARARGRTADAVRLLATLRPSTVLRLVDGTEQPIPLEAVRKGDMLRVRAGDRVPVDGVVVDGGGTADESMMTGESMPVDKGTGSPVTGGTMCTAGMMVMRAEKVGADTALSQIIALVEGASAGKPSVQRFADRIVRVFIPLLLGVAVVVFLLWYVVLGFPLLFSLTVFISIIVIACPCALGLATPAAVTVGVGRGAQLGLLVRSPEVLERCDRVTTVLFDKTGTLTIGKPSVEFVTGFGETEDEVLRCAASVEQHVNHPLASAIVVQARARGLALAEPADLATTGGLGVSATVGGQRVVVGSFAYLTQQGVDVGHLPAGAVERSSSDGSTVVCVAVEGKMAGLVGLRDTPRVSAVAAVAALKAMGFTVGLVTGDSRPAAEGVAAELGIVTVIAGVLPAQKAAEVSRLRSVGETVVFVGDGVNDAPALAAADVGIAVGRGADVAMESGHIVLVRDDLRDVAAAIQLSRAVMRRIRQNVFWAFAYNALLIPLAAGILYPFTGVTFRPEWGGLAMAFSSVTVVSLALRLRKFVPPVRQSEERPSVPVRPRSAGA